MTQQAPLIALLLASLLSAGSAYGVNRYIAAVIAPEAGSVERPAAGGRSVAEAPVRKPSAARRPRALSGSQYLDGIMRRNLFDVNIIATWNPNPAKAEDMSRSELKVKLLGTIVATPASFSSALIADDGDPYPKGYSIGDKLYDRTVEEISKGKVKLVRSDGTIEWLTISNEVTTTGTAPKPPKGNSTEGVQAVDDNRFQVEKDLFDKYINDLEGISRMGRALLHRGPDGEFDGYRLSAIRRNTLADQLGIKNGDIIHTVNGQPLTSVQSAMSAYDTMKSEASFCFEITRRGSPVELCYDVR